MTKPKINIIAAIAEKTHAIGNKGTLLFRISDDLKRFKTLTLGHPIIMGRKTFESIGKALPGRMNIVITKNKDFRAPDCEVVSSLEEAVQRGGEHDSEVFVIGGGETYHQALSLADTLYLTVVKSEQTGDVFFPDWRKKFTREIFRENRTDTKTGLEYYWTNLKRE